MPPSLEITGKAAIEVVRKTGAFIKQQRAKFHNGLVELKGFNDLVSFVDKEAEQMLVEQLSTILPGSGFITEENTASHQGEADLWIIDPLDGTTNFVHGIPCYCISVGLQRDGAMVLGIVYELNMDELFYSHAGGPATMNGNRISVSQALTPAAALVATGFPYTNFSRLEEYMKVFDWCMKNTRGIRRLGSAAADLAYVACGRFEMFYEYGLNPWDVAAGTFIVKQAGGIVTDFSGGDNCIYGKEIIAANLYTFEAFRKQIDFFMKSKG